MYKATKSLFLLIFFTYFVSCVEFGQRQVKNPINLVAGEGTTNASKGQWPWHTSLFLRMIKPPDTFICGATLISELTLLSGKSCI